jgi:Coatomer epsilon subunit
MWAHVMSQHHLTAVTYRLVPRTQPSPVMSAPDLLFAVRNNFYLGAYQHAISEASDLESLEEADKLERDIFVYRSYIELGSYEVGGRAVCRASDLRRWSFAWKMRRLADRANERL